MAYIDIATADGLLAYRATWAAFTVDQKTVALDLATRYLDTLYGAQYIGTISDPTQTELWPRSSTADNYSRTIATGTIPVGIQQATAEAAFLAASGETLLPNTVSSGGSTTSSTPSGVVTEETVEVGSLKSTKKYSAGGTTSETTTGVQLATEAGIPLIPLISSLMAAYITGAITQTGSSGVIYRDRS